MRLRVNIPQVDPTAMDEPEVCPCPKAEMVFGSEHTL